MKKVKLAVLMCLVLSLSSVVSGCSSVKIGNYEIGGIQKVEDSESNTSGKKKKRDAKETEEEVETDKETESTKKDDFGSIKDTEIETSEVVDNSESETSDIGRVGDEPDETKSEKIIGVRQYDKFKADMGDYEYLGIMTDNQLLSSMDNASIFYKLHGDKVSFVIVLYDDSLNKAGESISLTDMGDGELNSFIESIYGDDSYNVDVFIINDEGALYNEYSDDDMSLCFLIGMENSIMHGLALVTNDPSVNVRQEGIDLYSDIDFNGESCEKELDYTFNGNTTDLYAFNLTEEETTEPVDMGDTPGEVSIQAQSGKVTKFSSPDTFRINGNKLTLNKTTLFDTINMIGMAPDIKNYGGNTYFVTFEDSDSKTNKLEFETKGQDKTDVSTCVSVTYGSYYNNEYQLDEIPWGSTLDDVISVYGTPDKTVSDSIYSWSLSQNIEMTIFTTMYGVEQESVSFVELRYKS